MNWRTRQHTNTMNKLKQHILGEYNPEQKHQWNHIYMNKLKNTQPEESTSLKEDTDRLIY